MPLSVGDEFDTIPDLQRVWIPGHLNVGRNIKIVRSSDLYFVSVCASAPKNGWKDKPGVCQSHLQAKKTAEGKWKVTSLDTNHSCELVESSHKRQYNSRDLQACSNPLQAYVPSKQRKGTTKQVTDTARRDLGIEMKASQAYRIAETKRKDAPFQQIGQYFLLASYFRMLATQDPTGTHKLETRTCEWDPREDVFPEDENLSQRAASARAKFDIPLAPSSRRPQEPAVHVQQFERCYSAFGYHKSVAWREGIKIITVDGTFTTNGHHLHSTENV